MSCMAIYISTYIYTYSSTNYNGGRVVFCDKKADGREADVAWQWTQIDTM